MKIICEVCGKQAIDQQVREDDKYCTILKGAKAAFKKGTCICGYCAKDLDENGLFPEERGHL